MVAEHLGRIKQETRLRYWHHSALALYRYLYYERI